MDVSSDKTHTSASLSEQPWLYKPVTRWRHADDPFFTEGNKVCRLVSKHVASDPDTEEETEASSSDERFSCQISSCAASFSSAREYEAHYGAVHKNVCSECHWSFPTSHLLEIHVLEWHDNMFQLLATKQHMYQCLVESCEEKFPDARTRKVHLVKKHRYPSNFRFDRQLPKQKRKTTGKKSRGGNSDTMDQQEDMETTDFGNGIHQEHTESIVTECKANTKGSKMDKDLAKSRLGKNQTEAAQEEVPKSNEDTSVPSVGDTRQSASGRTFVYNVPKNFSFGQGVSRGFSRGRRGGGTRGRGKKKHWHQQAASETTTTNIEDVQFMELADALDDVT